MSGKSFLIAWRDALVASEVGASARLVGFVLSTHMNGSGGSCYPGIRLLGEETRLARQTVIDGVRELERAGLIEVERGAGTRSSSYQAILPSVTPIRPPGVAPPRLAVSDPDRPAVQSEEQRAPRGRSEDTQRASKENLHLEEDLELRASTKAPRAGQDDPDEERHFDHLWDDSGKPGRGCTWEPNS